MGHVWGRTNRGEETWRELAETSTSVVPETVFDRHSEIDLIREVPEHRFCMFPHYLDV